MATKRLDMTELSDEVVELLQMEICSAGKPGILQGLEERKVSASAEELSQALTELVRQGRARVEVLEDSRVPGGFGIFISLS